MLENVEVLFHSAIKFYFNNKIVYVDPYGLQEFTKDADIIFITHDHYDHFSIDDIQKIKKEDTVFILPESMNEKAIESGIETDKIIKVVPNKEYEYQKLKFETIPSYNINKKFHPKENNWIGYIIEVNNIRYYIAGDTDFTPESKNVKCDIALVPIGGTYTMNYEEAAKLVNQISPKIVIPIHYGKVVGTKQDAEKFKGILNRDIECVIMI